MIRTRTLAHITASSLILLLAGVGVALVFVFARLAAEPFNLLPYLPKIQSVLKEKGYQLSLESAWLSFDGSLNIDARHIRIEPQNYPQEALTVQQANLAVAPLQLLLGRIAFSQVVLNQPQIPLTVTKSAMRVLGQAIAFKKTEQPTDFMDIVEFLNSGGPWGYFYSALRQAQVIDGLVEVTSSLLPGENLLQGLQFTFQRRWGTGEALSLKGLLTTREGSMPLNFSATHEPHADKVALQLNIKDANTALVEPFLPDFAKNRIALTTTITCKTDMGEGNKFIAPQLEISARDVAINIPETYDQPLRYSRITGLLGYSDSVDGTLYIKYLKATDSYNTTAEITGNISTLFALPTFNLTAQVPHGNKESVVQYIPHGKGHDWVADNIIAATIKNATIGFYGKLIDHRLDGTEGRAHFDITGDLNNVEVTTYKGLPNATELAGRYTWKGNDMRIMVHQANLGGQKLQDVAVEITPIYSEEPNQIRIIGTLTGTSQQALEYAASALNFKTPLQIKGQHISALSLSFPAKPELTLVETLFKSSSDLLDMETDMPLKFGHLVSNNAVLDITQNSLEFNSSGFLNEQPITMFWWEDLQNLFQKTKVEINGQLDASLLQDHLPFTGTIDGIFGTAFTLNQTGEGRYQYTLAGDLTDTHLDLPVLGWVKPGGEQAKIAVLGSVKNGGDIIVADALSLTGLHTQVQGRAEVNLRNLGQSKLDFTAFKIGQTDASIKYQPHALNVKGKSLFVGALSRPETSPTSPANKVALFDEGVVNVLLDKLILPQTTVQNLKVQFKRTGGWWQSGTLTAGLADNANLRLDIKTTKAGTEATIKSDNAGEVIKLLPINARFKGGALEGGMVFIKNKKDGKANGTGHIHIKKIRVLNAPILFNILQILSLEALTSPGEGMLFDTILTPLTYDGNIHFADTKIKGPTLGLKLKGDINLKDNTLLVKGTAIPMRGINQAIAKIPLIGPLLTGSQEALIAADFTVKGSFDDPKVSINPLSFITPGIIKDIFR